MLVAAALLFYRLTDFPLYFFCDEALQGAEVASLLETGRDRAGAAWPLFFRGHGRFQLSLSVYWLLPFQALLGSSEFVVRSSHAVASLLGVAAAAFFVRRCIPASPLWTASPLVFYGAAFWYLHSRTGFEVVISASAWLVCLAIFPWLWRESASGSGPHRSDAPRRIGAWIGFIIAFAFCFYSYTPARGWALLSLVALVLAWLPRSYTQWRRTALLGFLVTLVIAPYLLSAVLRPDVAFGRLYDLLQGDTGFTWQRVDAAALYRLLTALSPGYWFSAETRFESWPRHMVAQMALIPAYYLPFAALGLVHCLRHFRARPEARALVLLFPVGVFPAALFDISPLRCIPVGLVYLLWSCIGLAVLGQILSRAMSAARAHLLGVAVVSLHLAWFNFHVFTDVRTAYPDYGFYGVQTGQREVFGWVRDNLDRYPMIHLTHAAFNGNEALVDFYLPTARRAQLRVRSAESPCVLEQTETQVWILRQERFAALERSGCAVQQQLLHTVVDPRGQPLFKAVVLTPVAGFVPPLEKAR